MVVMKSWTDGQIFFVFDTEFCQNEEDDPKDAIIYFYPQDTSDSIRCTLCCQLMGISRFLQFSFSPVSLIRLHRGKFATKSMGKYTLALKGSVEMPDSILKRQLDRLIQWFTFHFKNFETVQLASCGSRRVFLEKMSSIWNALLPVSQCGSNMLDLTLNVVPAIELPKRAGILHLQAAQLLEASQGHEAVIAGCIMCNKSVLYSQLPMSILHNLTFTFNRNKQSLPPGEIVPAVFEIPGGVSLTFVYLRHDEVEHLSRTFNKPLFLKQTTANMTPMLVLDESNRSTVSNDENQEIINEDQVLLACDETEDCQKTNKVDIVQQDLIMSKCQSKDGISDVPSSYESCGDSSMELSRVLNVDIPFESKSGSSSLVAEKNEVDDSEVIVSQNIFEKKIDILEDRPSELRDMKPGLVSQSLTSSESDTCKHVEESQRCVLYIQSYNDYTLILVLNSSAEKNAGLIHSLWKLGLTSLTSLERDVKNCFEMSPSKVSKGKSKYLYLHYDQKWNMAKAVHRLCVPLVKGIDHHCTLMKKEKLFNRGVQLLHEEFAEDSHLHEVTLRLQDFVVYGHQMASKETFFQTSTDCSKDLGFPHQADMMADISMTSKRRLEREQKIILL